jgi:hypothetical protein
MYIGDLIKFKDSTIKPTDPKFNIRIFLKYNNFNDISIKYLVLWDDDKMQCYEFPKERLEIL